MAKLTLVDLANLDNPTQAVSTINENFARIEEALEITLSRDGTTPNAMEDELNMDGQRIINLPAPVSDTEPARHGQLQQYVDEAEAARDIVVAAEAVVVAAEANVENLEADVEQIWEDVQIYGTPAFYDLAIFAGGLLADNEILFRYVAPRGFTIAAGASGYGRAGTAATAENVITFKKNGVSFGTATWAAAGTTATVSITSETTFAAGDLLSIENQANNDDTMADVAISLVCQRNP